MEVDDETLALDVIATVGPGGHYLAEEHTRKHMKTALKRGLEHDLVNGRYRDPIEVARERAAWVRANHHPEPLERGQGRGADPDPGSGAGRAGVAAMPGITREIPPSVTPPLAPIRSARRLRLLDDGQLADLRAATLEILETRSGSTCPSERVRREYEAHGALVDHATGVVRLPPDLVLAAMARAPRTYTMGGRTPDFDLLLDGSALYVATDGCGIRVVDRETGAVRGSTTADVADMARVADALPAVGFYWPIVSASDHPATAPGPRAARVVSQHRQARPDRDGHGRAGWPATRSRWPASSRAPRRRCGQRPPLSSLICAISPLAQDDEGMEAALVFAEAGVPVGIMSMANCGSTGPASIAGNLAQGDAEIIAALVLVQLVHPGAPVFHSMMPGVMDPRTGGFLTTSLSGEVAYGAGVEMAHAWGVPTLAGVFGTDAPEPGGWQVAAESAVNLTLCGLLGAETGSGMGLLDACTLLVHEQLVLDADLHERVRVNLAGLDTSPAAMALDVIREVGPRGHFLYQPHTRDGLRTMRFSSLTGRRTPDGTAVEPRDVARATVDRLLREHHPEPLDERVAAELARIVAAADAEAAADGTAGGEGPPGAMSPGRARRRHNRAIPRRTRDDRARNPPPRRSAPGPGAGRRVRGAAGPADGRPGHPHGRRARHGIARRHRRAIGLRRALRRHRPRLPPRHGPTRPPARSATSGSRPTAGSSSWSATGRRTGPASSRSTSTAPSCPAGPGRRATRATPSPWRSWVPTGSVYVAVRGARGRPADLHLDPPPPRRRRPGAAGLPGGAPRRAVLRHGRGPRWHGLPELRRRGRDDGRRGHHRAGHPPRRVHGRAAGPSSSRAGERSKGSGRTAPSSSPPSTSGAGGSP